MERMRYGIVSRTATYWNLYLGREQGLFAAEGIEVEVVETGGTALTIEALIDGNIELAGCSPDELISALPRGADLVVEVGGPGSLARSIAAIRYCGHISAVGNLAGKGTIDPGALFVKRASMCGIQVGSRDMFEDMNRAIETAKLEPVIDRVFGFTEARAAYEYLASGKHFGKVVIRVP